MTIIELTEIVKSRSFRKIKSRLKELNYFDCAKDKEMKCFNLRSFAGAKSITTEILATENGKYEFYGDILNGVNGYEKYEFIIITKNKIYKDKDLSFPFKMFIYYKEID